MAAKDFTPIGAVFSRLTVIGEVIKSSGGSRVRLKVLCRCQCGTEKEILRDSLRSGNAKSCGCMRREVSSERMTKIPTISHGTRYGRLTVSSEPFKLNSGGRWQVSCMCDCGASRTVECKKLLSGHTKSCGCLWKKHGHANMSSGTYKSWISAKNRCYSREDPSYSKYGGRGIKMSDRWRDSFENFLADMGERPEGMTLDRYPDVNGDYERSNCRWASNIEQANNKRCNVRHMFNGELKTVPEIAREIGMSIHSLKSRLRAGWSLERAISTPVRKMQPRLRVD